MEEPSYVTVVKCTIEIFLNMVISNIIGGLGNQMFQFAAGLAISKNRNVLYLLDVSSFRNYQLHQGFELNKVFDCNVGIANSHQILETLGWQNKNFVRNLVSQHRFSVFRRKEFIVEPHFQYWVEMENVPKNCFLQGFWQSEKYFSGIGEQVRRQFSFKLPLDNKNRRVAEKISNVNAVSMHVRRGDYANHAETNATHGLCSMNYYQSAVRYIVERVEAPHFFVFSDDVSWTKKNLKLNFPCEFVDINHGSESFNDMHLMSLCKHNIIANSSFSWWGAWLNKNPNKIVIAPQRWFKDSAINTKDLIPESWVRL